VFGAPVPVEAPPAPPTPLWTGRHGVPIAAVFATEDGVAAVTIDESNYARLWPALDGTREPLVLPLAMPREAVVVRDGDGFAIAALDVSGGFEVLAINAAGELVSHIKREPEPGVAAIVPHDGGFLALHRDQTLELLDTKGVRRAALLAAPGEHVVKLLHRNGRTLALARTKEGVRGHWIAADTLAWAEQTPKLTINLERVFLSPDHKRLVTFSTSRFEALMIDLETARSRAFASPNGENMSAGSMGVPVGFTAQNEVVFAFNDFELSTLEWWTLGQRKAAVLGGSSYALEFVAVDAPAVTERNVISFSGHELAIATRNNVRDPSEVAFLGYRTNRARGLRTSPVGVVATIGASAGLLDDNVHVARRVAAMQMLPLANDLALIHVAPRTEEKETKVHAREMITIDPAWLESPLGGLRPAPAPPRPRFALYDLEQRQDLQQWPMPRAFHFEPATQLLAIDRGSKVELARFDATTRNFGAPRALAAQSSQVALLDPGLSGGPIAMFVRTRGGTSEVRTLSDFAAELPAPVALDGTVEAVDRAGRLYVRESADTIVVHAGDTRTRIDGLKGWKLRPSPTGARIASFARSRLSLLDATGATMWSVGFPGISDAAWTPDGALIVLAGDIAKVDLATGRVIAAQCGWGFALRTHRPEPVDIPSTTETTCDH
jgi:hypothetical protein